MTQRTALVTGASSGIGRATALQLVDAGYEVYGAARRLDRLRSLPGVVPVELDITDQASVDALALSIPECDVVINNAGGAIGLDPVDVCNISDWQRMYELNTIGTLRVVQAMLPALRRAEGADIVVVTSTAASVLYPGGGGYTAAKHAEHALAGTLRLELCGEPIRVIEVAPGMVKTEEFSKNRFGGDEAKSDAVYEDVDGPLTAEDVAECIRWSISLPPHVNIDQLTVRPLAQAAQHLVHRGPIRRKGEQSE